MFCPSMVARFMRQYLIAYNTFQNVKSMQFANHNYEHRMSNHRKEEQLNDSGTTDNSKAVIEEKNRRTAPINKYPRHKTRKPITNSNIMVYKHRNPNKYQHCLHRDIRTTAVTMHILPNMDKINCWIILAKRHWKQKRYSGNNISSSTNPQVREQKNKKTKSGSHDQDNQQNII
ncbi:hypothetical protein AGLY_017192 [Aphis glycines]|uniref:Uncharacterized protein n=1 Tax=Aphis glycines TaxID=307491 RepID=A0A6G0SWD8_APHGL|nr:hypothetical protein AGLY_017192 [Aphis glycines]